MGKQHRNEVPGTEVGPKERRLEAADLADADRRRVLTTIAGAGTVVLAGCLGDGEEGTTYLVRFRDDGEWVEVTVPEDEQLMYPALEAGVDIPHRCEVGRCGDCTVKYDGDADEVVEHDGNEYLSEDQIADGWVLSCVAFARDDFDAEVRHPDDG